MSRKEKLKQQLLSRPTRFKWTDLILVMKNHGYEMSSARGGGSGRIFFNKKLNKIAKWHEPHPGNEVLRYVIDEAIALIKEQDNEK